MPMYFGGIAISVPKRNQGIFNNRRQNGGIFNSEMLLFPCRRLELSTEPNLM